MANCRRPRSSPFLSLVELQFKLSRIASHHEQVKISFHQLKSQIEIGLLEAEDVFASLATPLMSLVCLKTVEMAEGGRCSTIFMGADLNPLDYRRSKVGANSSENSMEGGDLINQILELECRIKPINLKSVEQLQDFGISYASTLFCAYKVLIESLKLWRRLIYPRLAVVNESVKHMPSTANIA